MIAVAARTPEDLAVRPLSIAPMIASLIGLASSGAIASGNAPGVAPLGDDVPAWIAWAGSACMTLAPLVIDRWLAYRAARRRALARHLEQRAAEELADNDQANDAHAREVKDRAAELRADAEASDAARGPRV